MMEKLTIYIFHLKAPVTPSIPNNFRYCEWSQMCDETRDDMKYFYGSLLDNKY